MGVSEAQWAEHKRVLEAHEPFDDFEFRRIVQAGDVRWFSITGRPLFDEHSRFRGYHGVGRDVTARKQAEERLRRSEERFRALAQMSSDWYWEQDEHFRFTHFAGGDHDANFDFTVLDREMTKAVKNGKIFSLGIKAGDDGTPS